MFFGDNVGNTIQRITHIDSYRILYRPHGSCYDHFIRNAIASKTEKFFLSNKVIVDNAINLLDSHNLQEFLNNRLLVPYNFQLCSNVNKNLEATLTYHLPLVYLIHSKEDLLDIEGGLLGYYPYVLFIANKTLYDLAVKMDIDQEKVFYSPFSVQNNLTDKIDHSLEKTIDVAIFIGAQDITSVKNITDKLDKMNLKTKIYSNDYSTKTLAEIFSSSKMVLELNPSNIYNIIYSINCGVPAIIYNKNHTGNQDYVYRNFEDMIEKIKHFTTTPSTLPLIGFSDDGARPIEEMLETINQKGLIL